MLQVLPDLSECLVLDPLVAVGYGANRQDAAQAVGKSGAGGIDGIINEDRLDLEAIYVQAKRQEEQIGGPEIQKSASFLFGYQAKKAVSITPSSFTAEAREHGNSIDIRISLINGNRVTGLTLDHGVGIASAGVYDSKAHRLRPL